MEAREEKEVQGRQKSMKPLMGMDYIPPHIRIWRQISLVLRWMDEQSKLDQERYKKLDKDLSKMMQGKLHQEQGGDIDTTGFELEKSLSTHMCPSVP